MSPFSILRVNWVIMVIQLEKVMLYGPVQSVHGTHLTDVMHPTLPSDQIKHIVEVATEQRGRIPE